MSERQSPSKDPLRKSREIAQESEAEIQTKRDEHVRSLEKATATWEILWHLHALQKLNSYIGDTIDGRPQTFRPEQIIMPIKTAKEMLAVSTTKEALLLVLEQIPLVGKIRERCITELIKVLELIHMYAKPNASVQEVLSGFDGLIAAGYWKLDICDEQKKVIERRDATQVMDAVHHVVSASTLEELNERVLKLYPFDLLDLKVYYEVVQRWHDPLAVPHLPAKLRDRFAQYARYRKANQAVSAQR